MIRHFQVSHELSIFTSPADSTLGSILYKSCSRALTLVYAPYSVRQADAMMEGLFAYKVQRSPSGSLGRTKEVERMSKGLQCPWVHNWVFCSSGSLLHLLKAGLVSVTEFTALENLPHSIKHSRSLLISLFQSGIR